MACWKRLFIFSLAYPLCADALSITVAKAADSTCPQWCVSGDLADVLKKCKWRSKTCGACPQCSALGDSCKHWCAAGRDLDRMSKCTFEACSGCSFCAGDEEPTSSEPQPAPIPGCAIPANKCGVHDYFTSCPAGSVCGAAGCFDCPVGHHVCDRNKPHYLATCPNTHHCTASGCELPAADLTHVTLCSRSDYCAAPAPGCLIPPSNCAAKDHFQSCPRGQICGGGGCYECSAGSHVCDRSKPHYLFSCPNTQHCTAIGCEYPAANMSEVTQCASGAYCP